MAEFIDCSDCFGTGMIEVPQYITVTRDMAVSIRAAKTHKWKARRPADPSLEEDDACPDCDGTGELAGDYFSPDGMAPCERCGGTGLI